MSAVRHVLNFHGIGPIRKALDPGEERVWLEQARFESLLDVIEPDDPIALTFDDGNASDLTIALPQLLKRNLKAEFFISTGKIGIDGYLDEAQIREIARAGMEIGSHGISHRAWRDFDESGLKTELEGSRAALEEILGSPVVRAACPLGSYDRRVLRGLEQAGYRRVYTSDGGPSRSDQWLQPRTSLGPADGPDSTRRLRATRYNGLENLLQRLKTAIKRRR